jgi:hypothetical protein
MTTDTTTSGRSHQPGDLLNRLGRHNHRVEWTMPIT